MNTRIAELWGRGKQVLHEEGWLSFLKKVLLYFESLKIRVWRKIITKSTFGKIYQPYYLANIKKGTKYYEIAQSVNKERLDTGMQLSEDDANALEKIVQMVQKEKIMIADIGSWKGISKSVEAKCVVDYNGKVFAVDHWEGSEGTWLKDEAQSSDIFSIFKRNMITLGVWDIVHPLVMDSLTASEIFTDGILDLIFIDADHRYECVKKDIAAWLSKLKDGGILCGHDCEGYYSEYSEEAKKMINEHLADEYIADMKCHPGVVKALHEIFQGKYSIMPNSNIWYYIKKSAGSTC